MSPSSHSLSARRARVTCLLMQATLASAYLGALGVAHAATNPVASCVATKMKAAGKHERSVLVCHVRALTRATAVDATCVARADALFVATFAAADRRGGCVHVGDAQAVGAAGDAFVDDLVTLAASAAAGTPCRIVMLTALGQYLARLAAAEATFKRRPDTPYVVAAAKAAAENVLKLAVARPPCGTTLDITKGARIARDHAAAVTAALACGDGLRDPFEQCDGADDDGCPGACAADCRCPVASPAFACLERPGPVTTLTGAQAPHYEDLALAPATKLDARAATFAADANNRYPLNLGGGADVCVAGGVVQGAYDRSLGWQMMHDLNNAGMRVENVHVTLDGPRVDDVTDALRPVGGPFTVRQAWLSYTRDDCVENDHLRGGLIVDSLFDGCYVAVSERPSPQIARTGINGRHDVLAIHRSLIRLQAMPGPRGGAPNDVGHGVFFKWDPHATALALHDDIFLAEQVAQSGPTTMGIPDAVVSCSNNVMVWLGAGTYPAPLPPCFTITTNRGVWDAAVADWKAHHPAIGSAAVTVAHP